MKYTLKRIIFYIRIFPACIAAGIKGRMTYRADFILGLFANALRQSLGFVFIMTVFGQIPEINGWNLDQIMFVYGMQAICCGLYEFISSGPWSIQRYVQEGTLDRLLLRPVGTLFSITTADVTFHGLGAAGFGLAVCIISLARLELRLSALTVLYWFICAICGTGIYFCLNMLAATLTFWITKTGGAMMIVQNTSEFSKYPSEIYGRFIQAVITFVLPFAFTSYFPASAILGVHDDLIYWTGPLIAAAVCMALTAGFWRFGLSRYQSAGG